MPPPREYRAYLCDVEGVLVQDKGYRAVPGSVAWFNGLAGRGLATCLVSNNTTHRPAELIDALRAAGFVVAPEQLVTALEIGARVLAAGGRRRLLWLGAPRLGAWWEEQGFALVGPVDGAPPDAVVLGLDPGLELPALDRALAALRGEAVALVALHRAPTWLDAAGGRRLGPGAWCAALEAATGREALVCGKPQERIYREALKRVGVTAPEALFISDDPEADLVTAKRLGMGTAFVLSGKNPDHGALGRLAQEDWPDVVCDRPELVG